MSKGLVYIQMINELIEAGHTPMNAIIHIHEQKGIEVEKLADIVRSNQKLKALVASEATSLKLLKKSG